METQNCWIVTFGTEVEAENEDYPYVCDWITEKVETELRKKFDHVSCQEDNRDGEQFSVRYRIETDWDLYKSKPEIGQFSINKYNYKLEILEIKKCDAVYKINFEELFKDLETCLYSKDVPFSTLATRLMLEAIECHGQGLYDASVIMCRSTIDSSLYLALKWSLTKDATFSGQFSDTDPWSGQNKSGIYWPQLKQEAIKQCFFCDNYLNALNLRVRRLGNFAAHIGENQVKEQKEWVKKYGPTYGELLEKALSGEKIKSKDIPPDQKRFTSKDESSIAIQETKQFLCKLVDVYRLRQVQ